MKWSEFFTSSIGKKFIMSLTGLFLISFLIVHVGVNACIWAMDGGLCLIRPHILWEPRWWCGL